jgi:hypothetical protein
MEITHVSSTLAILELEERIKFDYADTKNTNDKEGENRL